MRSPRSAFEFACRVGAFAALGWMLGNTVIRAKNAHVERVSGRDVAANIGAWTRTTSSAPLHVTLEVTPPAWATDWLAALRHGGRSVTWSGSPPPIAVSAEALVDPNGGVRIDVAAPAGANVAIRDAAGAIDSVRVASLGVAVTAPMAVGAIHAEVRGERASTAIPAPAKIKPVAIVGAAGWEGKFIASALEERGWPVDAHFTVAPRVDVTQGGANVVLDTSRVSALIAIDSTIDAYGAAVERFVRAGGGLVLVGRAGLARSVAALAPGTLSARTRPNLRPNDTIKLGTTGFYPVSLRDDGVALERRAEGVAIAARRVGSGRVILLGYDDSWRWRMAGAPGSEAAHREWWSSVVASVAYAPTARGDAAPPVAPAASGASSVASSAPVAELVERLGAPRVLAGAPSRAPLDRRVLLALIVILLLAEWTSRRLRGRR